MHYSLEGVEMTQKEIIDFLSKHPKKYYSCEELSSKLNVSKNTIAQRMKVLLKWDFVEFKYGLNRYRKCRIFKIKR